MPINSRILTTSKSLRTYYFLNKEEVEGLCSEHHELLLSHLEIDSQVTVNAQNQHEHENSQGASVSASSLSLNTASKTTTSSGKSSESKYEEKKQLAKPSYSDHPYHLAVELEDYLTQHTQHCIAFNERLEEIPRSWANLVGAFLETAKAKYQFEGQHHNDALQIFTESQKRIMFDSLSSLIEKELSASNHKLMRIRLRNFQFDFSGLDTKASDGGFVRFAGDVAIPEHAASGFNRRNGQSDAGTLTVVCRAAGVASQSHLVNRNVQDLDSSKRYPSMDIIGKFERYTSEDRTIHIRPYLIR